VKEVLAALAGNLPRSGTPTVQTTMAMNKNR
jgi:hypothetical protein